jgi:hypothetical protein
VSAPKKAPIFTRFFEIIGFNNNKKQSSSEDESLAEVWKRVIKSASTIKVEKAQVNTLLG